MSLSLDGSTVLLTGASSGIGREMALLLAPRVGVLALVARRVDRLEALRAQLTAANPKLTVHLLPCDLSDPAATAQLADTVAAQLGHVDVLINNAGVGDYGLYDQVPWARIEKMLALNVTSVALLTHRLVPAMVKKGHGGVLNISSGFGIGFSPGFAGYVGTKHFVTGFTESLRLDLTGTGVVVSQVCPGPVATEFAEVVAYPDGRDPAPAFSYISAAACARAALSGFERDRALILPGLIMKLLYLVMMMSPRFMKRLVQKGIAKKIRAKALRAASAPKQLV
jgi:uncharacterized protein